MTKESNIKFICEDFDATQEFPPLPSSKIIPEWYKNIPVSLSKIENYFI